MNYTKSGIIAVGAPMSRARILNEVELAEDKDMPQLLLLTDEGNEVADRFFRRVGCDPLRMTADGKLDTFKREELALGYFLSGVIFALNLR